MTRYYQPKALPKAPKRAATPKREPPSQHAIDRANHLKAERHRADAAKTYGRP